MRSISAFPAPTAAVELARGFAGEREIQAAGQLAEERRRRGLGGVSAPQKTSRARARQTRGDFADGFVRRLEPRGREVST
jgi:hypothetical protein